ncbi:uncharacterized protein K452DRAFT_362116 [Aplosporella prunicola CBS 121167]|uniref:BZIP domain-containing protein n=1 Tax=Aplosporella prunicola CBS 121167 TaxID=1176127 RepID=A0A6A6AYS3_9PEZI|nr:uncharacterized protein K452DRAFT_362116 [Aplosporella prunicola CBS 121167]KAF2137079.1 hypothetical protein K452DRAFT_362116 [Aplosporella prunicola CBS 121167]
MQSTTQLPIALLAPNRAEDDWSGLSDPARRRKIQNRLHQRAWRRRRAHHKLDQHQQDATTSTTLTAATAERPGQHRTTTCTLSASSALLMLSRFGARAYAAYLAGDPRTDLLLSLVQFNVLRALMQNNAALGFDLGWLACDAESVFCASATTTTTPPAQPAQPAPPHLRPTPLQLTTPHHPWIDLLPSPAMRNNILALGADYDDTALCAALVEFGADEPRERAGLVAWGADPADPAGWEVGEEFARLWGWVVWGAWDVCCATNMWRERRGERKLFGREWCAPPTNAG